MKEFTLLVKNNPKLFGFISQQVNLSDSSFFINVDIGLHPSIAIELCLKKGDVVKVTFEKVERANL